MKCMINFQKRSQSQNSKFLLSTIGLSAHQFSVLNEDAIKFFRFIGEATDLNFLKSMGNIVFNYLCKTIKKENMCYSFGLF